MTALLERLAKIRFPSLALLVGSVLLWASFLKLTEVKSLRFERYGNPIYPMFAAACALLALGGVAFFTGDVGPRSMRRRLAPEVTADDDRTTVRIGQNTLTVSAGRLEDHADERESLIVLPANEYFDDACINDTRSALGAFVQRRFPGRTVDIEGAIAGELADEPFAETTAGGRTRRSYGLGTVVYLDHPLGESVHLLVAAATTERAGEGLRGDLASLVTIVHEAHRVARDRRLATVRMPVIGAGHGAIKPERALLVILLAWAELLFAHPDHRMTVDVVVFRNAADAPPQVPIPEIRSFAALAVDVSRP